MNNLAKNVSVKINANIFLVRDVDIVRAVKAVLACKTYSRGDMKFFIDGKSVSWFDLLELYMNSEK